jgi:RimJ/RimL family protein N-acetyltransferase
VDVRTTTELAEFEAAVGAFLERDPVRNTVLLTVLDMLRAGGGYGHAAPWFAWAAVDRATVGAALRTPPYKVALSGMTGAAARALGSELASYEMPGAFGDLSTVASFAAAADRRHAVRIREIQYVQHKVVDPPPTAGAPRRFAERDADLYVQWEADFAAEAGVMPTADPLGSLRGRISTGGGLWLWEVDDQPVSMCGRSGAVAGVPRIGPVWTPPAHRRRGYAAALTAHVCRAAFDTGVQACTLFADAANPTPNGIYERIGFRAVAETVEADFV